MTVLYKISLSITVHEAGKDSYNDPDESQYIDLICRGEELKDIRESAGPIINSMIQLCAFKLDAQLTEKNIETE